ncbi:hypothetical protein GPJ56_010067 [Histomonas meleagridis]|uniref:uncharacterized protein n=1 Tax=Histomonas meleagridis TaxID=135588 RepID=UPI0035597E97|nr:hypothetical protein GPJ56_010067 [Histomonas meleagridis]KAH0805853.1 hypothetical protein GO595_001343 [Histomonas meleagridis]
MERKSFQPQELINLYEPSEEPEWECDMFGLVVSESQPPLGYQELILEITNESTKQSEENKFSNSSNNLYNDFESFSPEIDDLSFPSVLQNDSNKVDRRTNKNRQNKKGNKQKPKSKSKQSKPVFTSTVEEFGDKSISFQPWTAKPKLQPNSMKELLEKKDDQFNESKVIEIKLSPKKNENHNNRRQKRSYKDPNIDPSKIMFSKTEPSTHAPFVVYETNRNKRNHQPRFEVSNFVFSSSQNSH